MSQLLEKAVDAARGLPDAEQDCIAALILEEIADDHRWDEAFAKSPGKLAALLERARQQIRDGQTEAAGIDAL